MPSVCFYFQIHQPNRLKHYSYFDIGHVEEPFSDEKNGQIMRKVANKSYLPANRKILELIKRHQGRFRVSYSISGVAIDQMKRYAPEVLDSFKELAATGAVEFMAETYYHTLASVCDEVEFREQINMHCDLMKETFGVTPTVFRNTELIYNDRIGQIIADMGFKGMIAEGADDVLGWRSPNFVYRLPNSDLKLLLKNYKLSDDIAFRFSNSSWDNYPLTAPKFAYWVHQASGNGETVNLFMDYETFGEHQWEDTGIFNFLDYLPNAIFAHPHWDFATPSEVMSRYEPKADLHFTRTVSWADIDRDLTAWAGNRMQRRAISEAFAIGQEVRECNSPKALDHWRKLQTSDHFYYMCTKWFADGDVHAYFSPYQSPYDAFINYMNALTNFRENVLQKEKAKLAELIEAEQLANADEIYDRDILPVNERAKIPTKGPKKDISQILDISPADKQKRPELNA